LGMIDPFMFLRASLDSSQIGHKDLNKGQWNSVHRSKSTLQLLLESLLPFVRPTYHILRPGRWRRMLFSSSSSSTTLESQAKYFALNKEDPSERDRNSSTLEDWTDAEGQRGKKVSRTCVSLSSLSSRVVFRRS